jgi:putative sigma-54 modulation protein
MFFAGCLICLRRMRQPATHTFTNYLKQNIMKVTTEAVQFKADAKLLDFIEEKLSKLEKLSDQIINAKVKLRLENSGQVKDKVVEVSLNVPGDELFAKSTSKTFEAATDDVVKALGKQIKKFKSKYSR